MPVPFKLYMSKQVIEHCKNCGVDNNDPLHVGNHCAIAVLLNDLFPQVFVTAEYIYPFGINDRRSKILLPKIAQDFIKVFDSLSGAPRLRKMIPEFEFEIDIPDAVISMINIEGVFRKPYAIA